MSKSIKCDQCDSATINGLPCHETGCPNHHIDLATGKPYPIECRECGCDFQPNSNEQIYCDESCAGDSIMDGY